MVLDAVVGILDVFSLLYNNSNKYIINYIIYNIFYGVNYVLGGVYAECGGSFGLIILLFPLAAVKIFAI